MAYQGGGGYTSRSGLNARSHLMGGPGEQVQISIDPGAKFDFDSQVADLRSDVAKIKQLAYAIDDERKLSGQGIDSLEAALERAQVMLRGTVKRLNVVYHQSRSMFMLYVVLFSVFIVMAVFVVAKLHRLGRWFV